MVNTNASEHKDRITTKASVFFLVKLFSGTLISIINKISVKFMLLLFIFIFSFQHRNLLTTTTRADST